VPLSGGTHLSTEHQARIVDVCADAPDTRLWALAIRDAERAPMSVQGEIADLLEFNRELSFLDYVLLATGADPTTQRWLLACFTDDYLIALGPRDVVERLADHTMKGTFAAFAEYAGDPAWRADTRALFLAAARALLHYNEATPSAGVTVPDPTPD
jgi:hypothetical protein